jgi:hypothetical protein
MCCSMVWKLDRAGTPVGVAAFPSRGLTLDDEDVTGRNSNEVEVNAGSPSFLLTAGGMPATYAIDPRFAGSPVGDQDQQLGVALPSSFMPASGDQHARHGWRDHLAGRPACAQALFSLSH